MKMIVIGASAGGIQAIRKMFSELSVPLPVPVLVVLHMRVGPKIDYNQLFAPPRNLNAMEADDKIDPIPGSLYVAPPGYHLLVERSGTLALSVDPLVNWARPAIDVTFETAAEAFREQVIGILLSGASSDGAKGLKKIKDSGGVIIVQDPESSEFGIMPQSALAIVEPDYIKTPEEIGRFLNHWASKH